MYVKTVSPDSGQVLYLDVEVGFSVYKVFRGRDELHKYIMNNIRVVETTTLESLAEDIKRILLSVDKLPENLEKTLKDSFGISEEAIPELIEYMFPSRVKNRVENKQISPEDKSTVTAHKKCVKKRTRTPE